VILTEDSATTISETSGSFRW